MHFVNPSNTASYQPQLDVHLRLQCLNVRVQKPLPSATSSRTLWQGQNVFPDPGSDFFPSRILDPRIPDPNFFCPGSGSRIRIKELKYFNPKKWFLSCRKYDPGCSLRIQDTGSRIQGSKGHRIPDPGSGPQHWARILRNGIKR